MKKIYVLLCAFALGFVIVSCNNAKAEEYKKLASQQYVKSVLPSFKMTRNFEKFQSKKLKDYAVYTFEISNSSTNNYAVKDIIVSNVYDKDEVISSIKNDKNSDEAIKELNEKIPNLKNIPTNLNANSKITWTVLSAKNPVVVKTKPVVRVILAKKDGEVFECDFNI